MAYNDKRPSMGRACLPAMVLLIQSAWAADPAARPAFDAIVAVLACAAVLLLSAQTTAAIAEAAAKLHDAQPDPAPTTPCKSAECMLR